MTEIKRKRGRPRKIPLEQNQELKAAVDNLLSKSNTKRIYRKSTKKESEKIKDLQNKLDEELPEIKLKAKNLKSNKIKRIKVCLCGEEVGRKVRTCKKCGHTFEFKKVGRYEEIKDWKSLKDGSIIYLRKGSRGPYYMGEKSKILMGYRGKYVVKHIVDNGLEAYGGVGFAFIYMGPTKYNEETGIYSRRYRLYKKT